MTNIVKVDFYGDTLNVLRDADGDWASIPQICGILGGASDQKQVQRLRREEWAEGLVAMKDTSDARGQIRPTWHVNVKILAMWLATMSASRVAPEVRPKLVRYQRECARVLHDALLGHRTDDTSAVAALAAKVDRLFQLLEPAAANPERFESTAEVRDNRLFADDIRRLIKRCSQIEGKSFQAVHGAVRKAFGAISYLRVRLALFPLLKGALQERLERGPAKPEPKALPAAQTALFPDALDLPRKLH